MEEWKPVNGYEGLYDVSSKGEIFSRYTNKVLRSAICGGGYLGASLVMDKKKKTEYIHRLVAKAFLDNEMNNPAVNHIDGNKLNNNKENLEWVSYKENTNHAIELGLMGSGDTHPMFGKTHSDEAKRKMSITKLGKSGAEHPRSTKIAKVCLATGNIIEEYESQHIASKENNVSQGNINMVLNGKRSHTGGYSWIYVSN